MYTILMRMLNTEEEAEDALQNAFIQIFHSLHNFKFNSTLGAWIKTIVIRAGLAMQQNPIDFQPLDSSHERIKSSEWDQNLTGAYLEKGIKELSEGYRNVFLLIEVEGYSHKEVGELLGISEGTSKSQLFHAKRILQKKLKELMY